MIRTNRTNPFRNYYDVDSEPMCRHGTLSRYPCSDCDDEDDPYIDKCLNCGRYRASSSLTRDQCCAKGCKNPNEY